MWGEIEPPVKTQPSLCERESEDDVKLPEPMLLPRRCDVTFPPADPPQPRPDAQVTSPASVSLHIMYISALDDLFLFCFICCVSDRHPVRERGRVRLCK